MKPSAYISCRSVFTDGVNVAEDDVEVWGDVLFKRLWLSGSRARFYNVDWRSDIGGPANYQENASNAFVVASQIANTIKSIPGEKVVMAHSLGNVVSEQYRRCGPGPSHSTTVNLAGIRPSAAAGQNIVRGVNFRKYPLARGESV